MRRMATEPLEGSAPKRSRNNTVSTLRVDPDLESEQNDHASDTESRYTEITSGFQIDTPLTPLSPARKWPSDLKTIRCTYPGCNKTFNRPARLAAHLRSHNNERPYKCPYSGCDKDYIEEKHLKQHIKGSHTAERDHLCTYEGCGKKFMTATRLRRHQLVHEGQERFRCRDFSPCSQSFRKHQTLLRHIRTEHQHKSAFECNYREGESSPICGKGFDTAGGLRRHQERDHGDNRFWCDECAAQIDDVGKHREVGFPTLNLLQAHMKRCHVNCMFCGRSCNGREELEMHIELDHTNQNSAEERKVVACTWPGCTKSFTRTSNLNVHIRTAHEGIRFVCGEFDLSKTEDLATWSNSQGCGQAFGLKFALENHVRYVHLMRHRPEKTSRPAGQLKAPTRHAEHTMLEQLTGVGRNTRRTVACTFSGCQLKFTYSGDLEAHIQAEHKIDQALLDGITGLDAISSPSAIFAAASQDMANWEVNYDGSPFWVGGEVNTGALDTIIGGNDEEWLRDVAEMRRLIDGEDLNDLIDPSLG